MSTKLTIKKWGVVTGIKVLDPDGFDRTDSNVMSRTYTLKEFILGAAHCTCQWRKGSIILIDELLDIFKELETKEQNQAIVKQKSLEIINQITAGYALPSPTEIINIYIETSKKLGGE